MLRKVAYVGLELKERSIPEKVERKTQETDKFLGITGYIYTYTLFNKLI